MTDNSADDMIIAIGVDLATIKRGLKRLEQEVGASTSKVQKQFDAVSRGIDGAMTTAMQNRINAMTGIGVKGAKEWTGALADQGKELERLRARYSPLFATINNYKSAIVDIKRAHALGAISADEMVAAVGRERRAALESTAAIKARNAVLAQAGSGRLVPGAQTANIAAQFQDIAVTSAMGMSPIQIALQQGTQLSSVLGTMGGGRQIISGLGAAFASLVSPVSLVTVGLVAGSAALIQYISSAGSIKTADDAIKSHADAIADIKDAYGVAADGLGEYVKRSQVEAAAAARENLKVQQDVARAATADFSQMMGVLQARTGGASDVATRFQPFAEAIRDFRKSVADGVPDFVRFRDQIEAVVPTDPGGLRLLADELINGSRAAADADRRVRSAKDVIAGIGKIALEQTNGIGSLTDALRDLATIAAPALTDAERALESYRKAMSTAQGAEDRRAATKAYDDARRRIDDASPTVESVDGKRVAVPVPGEKPSRLGDEPDKKAETAAQKAANAYRDLIKSADDRIGQLRLEVELTGQYGVATDAARFRLELLQQSEDKGRSLTSAQRAEIEQKVALYEKFSQALAETKLQQDLLNQARFSSLSKQDQQIVTTLRQYGLSEDLNSNNAAMIRQSLRREEMNSAIDDFSSSLANSIVASGGDIGEAFGKTFLSALQESAQKQLANVFSQILKGVFSPESLGGASVVQAVSASAARSVSFGSGVAHPQAASIPTTDIAAYIRSAAIQRGIDPDVALRVAKSEGGLDSWNLQSKVINNGVQEPSFGPFQLYKGGGLGNAFMAKTGLDPALAVNGPAGVDFALDHAASNGWGAWFGAANSGIGNFEGIGQAAKSIQGLGAAASESTKGLGGLSGGLQAITQNFGPGAGLGGFDWTSLFSSSFAPTTTLGNFLKGIPGFEGGGGTGRGSRSGGADGRGGFLAMLHPDETVIDHTRVNAPRAPRLNPAGGSRIVRNESSLTVQISGASGDPHVRELVRQGVQEALAGQQEQMRRGGLGEMQDRFVSQRR